MAQNTETDLPVLNDVVESGNESIIQSSRLGREVLRELEALRHLTGSASDPLLDYSEQDMHHVLDVDDADELIEQPTTSQPDRSMAPSLLVSGDNRYATDADDELELLIDEVVDRHIIELRKDIKRLLERALNKP